MTALDTALGLVKLGVPVFKVRLTKEGVKEPWGHANGHLDATLDPGLVTDWFIENQSAKVGAVMGDAGLIALDIDTKNSHDGWDSLDKAWVAVPSTFGYDTPSGGRHLIYTAPKDKNLAPSANYRGMDGVDIRAGSSWVLWNGDAPKSRDEFASAPEWMLDEKSVKSAEGFQGTVREWYNSLESGAPNALVRGAIERVKPDMSHSDMVAATYEAIRLGAEGAMGVPDLLSALEEAWLNREPGHHTTPEDRWEFKFHEALASGIEKHGAAISLRSELPEYSVSLLPANVSDSLVSGTDGTKDTFRDLLAKLIEAGVDDLTATAILWGNPKTGPLAKDWGLEFVYKRVQQARVTPEPIRENPALAEVEVLGEEHSTSEYLTDKELAEVQDTDTFIDGYINASASKGFVNTDFAVPAAWTCLGMAFGTKAFVPIGSTPLEMNLWFTVLGLSGTGKTSESEFMKDVLNVLMNEDNDVSYTMSPNSSPEGMELDLLYRDGLPTLIYEDEASSFFMNLRTKDWMASLTDRFALWFNGRVKGSTKLSAKDMRGMSATTSLSSYMGATPDRLISLIDASMFASGFMARTNWVWGAPPVNPDAKYEITYANTTEKRIAPAAYELAVDLAVLSNSMKPTAIIGTEAATKRIVKAYKAMDKRAQKHRRYDSIEPSMTRLKETLMKCSALTALSRGATTFDVEDVLVAIYYAETWFKTLLRVADEISESPYSRDLDHIVHFVDESGGKVLRSTLLHEMRGKVLRNKSEIDDRIGYLLESGRLNRIEQNREIAYELNGK